MKSNVRLEFKSFFSSFRLFVLQKIEPNKTGFHCDVDKIFGQLLYGVALLVCLLCTADIRIRNLLFFFFYSFAEHRVYIVWI